MRAVATDLALLKPLSRAGYRPLLEAGVRIFHPETISIGDRVYIGHEAILKGYHRGYMEIGDDTWIGAHAVVEGRTTIGRRNRIFHGAVLGAPPQDLKYRGEESRLEIVSLPPGTTCIDCGTPAQYLAANLAWSGGESVICPGAVVEGTIEQSVVWPGAHVHPEEHLTRAIRAAERVTVLVR